MLANEKLDELLALAEKATKGRWFWEREPQPANGDPPILYAWLLSEESPNYDVFTCVLQACPLDDPPRDVEIDAAIEMNDYNADFIATCSPETIIALIARLRDAERERDQWRQSHEFNATSFTKTKTELEAQIAKLQRTKGYVVRSCYALEKVRELYEINEKMRPWTDKQAFSAFNRKVTEAYRGACRELVVLLGKDNFDTLLTPGYSNEHGPDRSEK